MRFFEKFCCFIPNYCIIAVYSTQYFLIDKGWFALKKAINKPQFLIDKTDI